VRISIARNPEDAREEGRPAVASADLQPFKRQVVPRWPSADLQPLKRQGCRADSDSDSWLGTDGNQLRPGASEKGAADDAALSLRKIETSLSRGFRSREQQRRNP
jgi:hypothetical protein